MDTSHLTEAAGDSVMTRFRVRSDRRGHPVEWAFYAVWLGMTVVLPWLLGRDSMTVVVLFTIFGLLPIPLYLRNVVEIRLLEGGVLEVVRIMGATRIAARDLLVIEGYWKQGYEGDGE
jgi:hypothetical protein